jgi:hypothetical protein
MVDPTVSVHKRNEVSTALIADVTSPSGLLSSWCGNVLLASDWMGVHLGLRQFVFHRDISRRQLHEQFRAVRAI